MPFLGPVNSRPSRRQCIASDLISFFISDLSILPLLLFVLGRESHFVGGLKTPQEARSEQSYGLLSIQHDNHDDKCTIIPVSCSHSTWVSWQHVGLNVWLGTAWYEILYIVLSLTCLRSAHRTSKSAQSKFLLRRWHHWHNLFPPKLNIIMPFVAPDLCAKYIPV